MNFFTFDMRKIFITTLLVAIPLISVNIHRGSEDLPWFLVPFSIVAGGVQKAYSSFSSGVRGTTALYLDLINIKKENQELVKENAELRAQLGALTELRLENQRLNQLLQFKRKSEMDLLAAKVIGNDLIPNHSTITINRGTAHGIEKNMAAITVGGVVGYVIQPEAFTSQLLLLTDRYAAIDAIVQRSRARGIIEGKTKTICRLNYLQRGDDVKKGDLVVTSGLDNIFPKGFPVGTVTYVKKSEFGVSQEVDIKPTINPFTLEEIFIVLNARNENIKEKKDEEQEETPKLEPKPEIKKTTALKEEVQTRTE